MRKALGMGVRRRPKRGLSTWFAAKAPGKRLVQPCRKVLRKRDGLGLTINVYRFARGIDDNPAILAACEMYFHLAYALGVKLSVQIAGKFDDESATVHALALCRKIGCSFSRSFRRERSNRDFTAGTETPSISAVSSVESPSTSRSRKTVRKMGSSSPMAAVSIEFNSLRSYRCSGVGPQSSISRGIKSSWVATGSSSEVTLDRRLRSRMRASFTAMRTSQV